MKFTRKLVLAALAASLSFSYSPVQASEKVNVLVIDSGSDFTHDALKPLALPNALELNGKAGVDDDKNGYIDDIFGWNFVENSATGKPFDTPPDYDRVFALHGLLGKLQVHGKEGMTPEEFQLSLNTTTIRNSGPGKFCRWLGTRAHCAGIVSTKNDGVNLNAIKHIQTGGHRKKKPLRL